MARRRYPYRSYRASRDIGRERALQHIEDYRRLEAELGGSVEDVKQYFFSLHPHQLRGILDAYGRQYGAQARDYAERTIRRWQNGEVHMAGQTAERLFRLLPSRMPLAAKYQLVESLWNHVGPKSKRTLCVGLDASIEQVTEAVRKHMDDVVTHFRIPEQLERRFEWLAAGDSHVKQDLLNHLQQYEKQLVAEGARVQIPVMIEHLRNEGGQYIHRLAQVLRIGNHELELALDKTASGVAIAEPTLTLPTAAAAAVKEGANYTWLFWVLVAIAVLYFLTHH
jgi:hypothetical protein